MDYVVHGMVRRSSLNNTDRIDHLLDRENQSRESTELHFGVLTEGSRLETLWSRSSRRGLLPGGQFM
jgi:GDP-D-mannose dehydratase